MNAFANTFLLIYAGLFPIVNPIGSAPIFLSLTRPWSAHERNALAMRVAINSFFLLLGSLFVGSHVLAFFGNHLARRAHRRRYGGDGVRLEDAASG